MYSAIPEPLAFILDALGRIKHIRVFGQAELTVNRRPIRTLCRTRPLLAYLMNLLQMCRRLPLRILNLKQTQFIHIRLLHAARLRFVVVESRQANLRASAHIRILLGCFQNSREIRRNGRVPPVN